MTSRTHDVFAFASLITVASHYPPSSLNITTAIVSSIGSVVGCLLPDIDQVTNRLWDLLPGGHLIGGILKKIFLSHRTISHSILGTFVIYKLLGLVLYKIFNPGFVNIQVIYASIMIGFISHLALDCFTEEGLPLFFPLRFKIGFPPVSSWRIKTGKWFEKFVVFPGIIAYVIWFVSGNQERLVNLLKLVVR